MKSGSLQNILLVDLYAKVDQNFDDVNMVSFCGPVEGSLVDFVMLVYNKGVILYKRNNLIVIAIFYSLEEFPRGYPPRKWLVVKYFTFIDLIRF